jgi:hypothetical protein
VRRIVAEKKIIRAEWKKERCYLHPKMVKAVIGTAELIASGWDEFRKEYLCLPENPETDSFTEWKEAHAALDRLPMVGEATAWYLIRNLYGVSVFKPDVHILAIARHFFPKAASPVDAVNAMTRAVRRLWPVACDDKRFQPVHFGEVDYILWWYRSQTGLPKSSAGSTHC